MSAAVPSIAAERDDRATQTTARLQPLLRERLGWDRNREALAVLVLWTVARLSGQCITITRGRRRALADCLKIGEGSFMRAVEDLAALDIFGVLRVDGRVIAAWLITDETGDARKGRV